MAIPADAPVPGFEARVEMVFKSSNEELERIRQHALGRMRSLLQGTGNVPPEYVEWSSFVGEIEAEQRRRGAASN
jgi:hypothetical protein